jgi:hypothetical protein
MCTAAANIVMRLNKPWPKIVHSSQKHKFCTFLGASGKQKALNSPKHHFGSNVVEQMLLARNQFHNFGTQK